jgi:hypothetical protein
MAPQPSDAFADNPKEVNEFLSRYPLRFKIQDLPTLVAQDTANGQVDDILSNQLLQLSLQDRNAINEEIHGVQTFAPEETSEMLTEALENMDTEIEKISNKDAFVRSQEFPNTYVNSADFRLRFLRSDLFDVKKAAKKMVTFLDLMSELFGDFALKRQIQMSDFSKEEMQVFRTGHLQLLPYRDRSGRRIFCTVGGYGVTVSLVTRVSWFLQTFVWLGSFCLHQKVYQNCPRGAPEYLNIMRYANERLTSCTHRQLSHTYI